MSQTELPTPEYVANLIYPVGSVLLLASDKTPNGAGIPFTWERRNFGLCNINSGKALDVSGAGTKDGANVDTWEPNYSKAQSWWFTTVVADTTTFAGSLDMWVRTK
jgi:hypothetical protein